MSNIQHSNLHEDLSSSKAKDQQACTEPCPEPKVPPEGPRGKRGDSQRESERIWSDALQQLELQMTRATFDTWLKGTTAELDGDTLTVTVANPFGQEWLDQRLRPKIEAAVATAAGRSLSIAFTVRGHRPVTPAKAHDMPPPRPQPASGRSRGEGPKHYEIWAPADPTVLRILPGLAEEIGLNESIILLQLDYWIRHSDNVRDGRRWTYQSAREMQQKAFKWWSHATISRTTNRLEAQALIFATDKYNKSQLNHTRWYALNPAGFKRLQSVELKPVTGAVQLYQIWAPADPTVLRIMPDLAAEIGLNESIVLLQLDYWIRHSDNVRDGRRWTFQSMRGMQRKAFRWWSRETVRRAVTSLEAQALIFVTGQYNCHQYDMSYWYALNPEGFKRLRSVELKRIATDEQYNIPTAARKGRAPAGLEPAGGTDLRCLILCQGGTRCNIGDTD